VAVTIPPAVLATVRDGAYGLIGHAVEVIADALDLPDRQQHEQEYRMGLARLQRAFALLDVVGWQTPPPGNPLKERSPAPVVTVEAEKAVTLYEALQDGLEGEESLADSRRESQQATERTVEAVREFMDTLGAHAHE
jgi:hypothetical protein